MNRSTTNTTANFVDAIAADPYAIAAKYYASHLAGNPKAIAFLTGEFNLILEQAAEAEIGFSNRQLGKQLPNNGSVRGRAIRSKLTEAGLFKRSGHEALRGCLTIPLRDDQGKITGIEGRRIDPHGKGPQVVSIGCGDHQLPDPLPPRAATELPPIVPREPPNGPHAQPEPGTCQRPEPAEPETPQKQPPVQKEPSTPAADPDLIISDSQVTFLRENRRYRIRGLEKNTSVCMLKVNIMASRDDLVHLDTIDLVKARSRASFIKATASELYVDAEVIKKDVGQLLLKLENLREERIAQARSVRDKTVKLSQKETDEALKLLRDPDLLRRIVDDIDACGMVGERTNKLAGYLAATSRKLDQPLAIIIQSSSSAGKTSLMDAVLAMIPEEEVTCYTGMTGQSLFYLDSDSIRHKVLAISEDEGVSEAAYALKLLQSEGKLRHAAVTRDAGGNMVTRESQVEGPVQIMLTTTAMDVDEELVNRCLVLSVDESRDQTGATQAKQRDGRTLDAIRSAETASRLQKLHQNAQRLLKPLRVVNPYAPQLRFASDKTRSRRDHAKYLTLIDSITLLHQYQRTVHQAEIGDQTIEYINVEVSDIAVAGELAGEILGRSLDELSPQTRRLLMLLDQFVIERAKAAGIHRSAFRFTRREVRSATGWSDFQVHKHLTRLVDLEYLLVHRGRQGRRFSYELLYTGEGVEGEPFLLGLIDPKNLAGPTSAKSLSPQDTSLGPKLASDSPSLGGAFQSQNHAPDELKLPGSQSA